MTLLVMNPNIKYKVLLVTQSSFHGYRKESTQTIKLLCVITALRQCFVKNFQFIRCGRSTAEKKIRHFCYTR